MTVSAQRFWVWLFSLAFVLLSAFDGYRLIDLESSPWEGDPSSVRALRAQLDRLSTTQEVPPVIEWREPYESESRDAGLAAQDGQSTSPDSLADPDGDAFVPPVLAGVVSVMGLDERVVFRALLDGKMRDTGERVGAFLISRISEKGVTLRYRGGHVFLATPDPIFSIDDGDTPSTP
jgi:hypothetical protein